MKKIIMSFVCLTILFNSLAFAGVDSKKAEFVGGTLKDKYFPNQKKNVEGMLKTEDEKMLKFQYRLGSEQKIYEIPYDQILDIEYGQKAGRRVGAAIATAILISPVGLFLLFSKKRKHFVTIGYKDEAGTEQVAVFELGKGIVRTTLPILKARSGKEITYQDEEAKKSGKGTE